MKSYYDAQLMKLKDYEEFNKGIKIFDGNGHNTNQMDLNLGCIEALEDFLRKEKKRLKSLKK